MLRREKSHTERTSCHVRGLAQRGQGVLVIKCATIELPSLGLLGGGGVADNEISGLSAKVSEIAGQLWLSIHFISIMTLGLFLPKMSDSRVQNKIAPGPLAEPRGAENVATELLSGLFTTAREVCV